jgi:hypothetical protein
MLPYLASLLLGSAQPEVDAVALQELLAASRPLVSASSYRVMVRVERELPLAAVHATARNLEALYQHDQPLRLLAEEIEAFRGEDRIAYRARGTGEPWKVVTFEEARHEGPFPVLAVMARLALPHELLSDLESRLRSLRRVENTEDGASVDYEGVLEDSVPSLLVVTVSHAGILEEIRLRPASGVPAADLEDGTWTYVVDEMNRIIVSVPGEVRKLLQGSPQGRTLGAAPPVGLSKGEMKMMFATLAGAILLGMAAPQEPQKPPQEPPTRTEAQDPADRVTKLKTAAAGIAEATSYRFELEARIDPEALAKKLPEAASEAQRPQQGQGKQEPPQHPQEDRRSEGLAPAKQEEITIEMQGEYVRSLPIHFESEEMEAYRMAQKVAFRVGDDGQWRLQTDAPRSPLDHGAPAHAGEDAARGKDMPASEALWAACVLPTPHDLLRDLSTKVSGSNVTEKVDKGGLLGRDKVVYEVQLDPECIQECLQSFGSPKEVTCIARVTTGSGGEIEQIELTASRKHAAPRAPAAAAATAEAAEDAAELAIVRSIDHEPDLSLCYRLKDVNDRVAVEVPEEARELLSGGRSPH